MASIWYLEGAAAGGNALVIPIEGLPFIVGRTESCALTIVSYDISRQHARIDSDGRGGLQVHDLGSTNGTFVNRERLTKPRKVSNGDIIHFGTSEFRLKYRVPEGMGSKPNKGRDDSTFFVPGQFSLPQAFPAQESEFLEMLDQGLLCAAFQPIVNFHDRHTVGFELLGRGRHPTLPASPANLFALAASLQKEVELSEAFRMVGAHKAAQQKVATRLFINAHPREMFSQALYDSLSRFHAIAPAVDIVLEVPETAITEIANMRKLAERLRDMGVRLAYDDFGAGQARINELAEVPPDVVKFDMSLIRDIHCASAGKQQVVSRLVSMVRELGSIPLAEGVETEDEARTCQQMGFALCQGYLTGKPVIL
ncbi:MAG: EAL domain-containing protein [Rhodocyclaceae bacterium]|nr:EAL domain-containing protein [Rhodocyclaceae bacterium]